MSERRTTARHRKKVKVSFGGRVPAFTADLNGDGFCAEMPGVFLPGAEVHGTLGLRGCDLPFRGVVVWASPSQPQTSTRSRFGVRITELGAGVRGLPKR